MPMELPAHKTNLRDDELAAALDRCARVAGVLVLSAIGMAVLYFGAVFLLSR